MKKHVLVGVLLSLTFCSVLAQNKTLGVGTLTPNSNAVLHVDAPNGNQGFIMPKLSTSQRTAPGFTSILSAIDNGLMVYDTDKKTIYIWNGSQWITSADVAGGTKLTYPYVDTIMSAPNNSNLLRLLYASSGVENVGVAQFENLNPDNGFSALFARTNSATNGAADFVVTNPANNNDVVGAITNGVGRAGSFTINNTSSQSFAILAETNGDSLGAAVHGNNTGNGFGVFGKSAGTKFASAAVYGEHTGTGDAAGAFRISNPSNPYAALYGETNGAGSAIRGESLAGATSPTIFASQLGTGRAGQFQITNTLNTNPAIRAYTDGLSNAGFFTIANVANTFPGVFSTTNGTGAAIHGENSGTGNGIAGLFRITNATNTYPAIQAEVLGSGAGVTVFQTTGTGTGINLFMQNTASTAHAVNADQAGLGHAGNFYIRTASNNSSAVFGLTDGIGRAGQFIKNNATSTTAAVTVTSNVTTSTPSLESFHNGTGDAIYGVATNGSGGNFQNFTPGNAASTLFAQTNSTAGHALGLINNAEGRALSIFQGGMKVSTATLTSGNAITTRAAAYLIQGPGPFSFDAGLSLQDGDIFYFYNDTASSVSVSGVGIPAASGKTFIYLGGALRGL